MKFLIFFYIIYVETTFIHALSYSYVGCFLDDVEDRDLVRFLDETDKLTIEQCLVGCLSENYRYAGIQFGSECRCGDSFGKHGVANEDQCNFRCSPNEKCGGEYRNSIYRLAQPEEICETDLVGYQGCFHRRTLPIDIGRVQSISQCIQLCGRNYEYAALRDGQNCQCGLTIHHDMPLGRFACHSLCPNHIERQMKVCCGGSNSISVYRVKSYVNVRLVKSFQQQISRVKRAADVNRSTSNILTASFDLSGRNVSVNNNTNITTTTATTDTTTTATTTTVTTTTATTDTTTTTATTTTATTTTATTTTATTVTTTTATTATTTTATTTTSTTTTTTVTNRASDIISTIFFLSSTQNLNPNASSTRQSVQDGLNRTINHSFRCVADSSLSNCTQIVGSGRRKRQSCIQGFTVNLVSNIIQVSGGLPGRYQVNYLVESLCSGSIIMTPTQVRTAMNTLSRDVTTNLFGFQFDGDFIRSTSSSEVSSSPSVDRKLWLIGATIGPVVFVLLLIFVFCFLHFKCRPRTENRPLTKPIFPPTISSTIVEKETKETEKSPVEGLVVPSFRSSTTKKSPTSMQKLIENDGAQSTGRISPPFKLDDVPIDEIRQQNQVERWRNKIRLQDKFQEQEKFSRSKEQLAIGPAEDRNSDDSIRNREEIRAKKRRERRKIRHNDERTSIGENAATQTAAIRHVPVRPVLLDRPDPRTVNLYYNPYLAADRAHQISRFDQVELIPKPVENRIETSSTPEKIDRSIIPDRAQTATNSFSPRKRPAKVILENDQQANLRINETRTNRNQKYSDDYKNEYLLAKRSVVNTKNILSEIQDELRTINSTDNDDFYKA